MSVLNIKNQEAYQLAAELAQLTGKSLTRVVLDALRQERERLKPPQFDETRIRESLARIDRMPVVDPRSPDELLGYNPHGTFD
jgi:hypothetical protein